MSVSRTVSEIPSVKEWRDLERGRSRSLKLALFDRSYTTFYWSDIVNIALFCTVFELLEITQGHSKWYHSKACVRFPIRLP